MSLSPTGARALMLLKAGLLGWHVAALTVVGLGLARAGGAGAVSALLGAGMVLAFSGAGMGVQVLVADRHPKQVLVASLASYAVRAAMLGGALWAYMENADRLAGLRPGWVAAGILVCVAGWLAGELVAFRRMRIPTYDTVYEPPAGDAS